VIFSGDSKEKVASLLKGKVFDQEEKGPLIRGEKEKGEGGVYGVIDMCPKTSPKLHIPLNLSKKGAIKYGRCWEERKHDSDRNSIKGGGLGFYIVYALREIKSVLFIFMNFREKNERKTSPNLKERRGGGRSKAINQRQRGSVLGGGGYPLGKVL